MTGFEEVFGGTRLSSASLIVGAKDYLLIGRDSARYKDAKTILFVSLKIAACSLKHAKIAGLSRVTVL